MNIPLGPTTIWQTYQKRIVWGEAEVSAGKCQQAEDLQVPVQKGVHTTAPWSTAARWITSLSTTYMAAKMLNQWRDFVPDMRMPMTGVIAQDVQRVLPDAVSRSGPCTLSNGQAIDDVLIVDKDRIFIGSKVYQKSTKSSFPEQEIM